VFPDAATALRRSLRGKACGRSDFASGLVPECVPDFNMGILAVYPKSRFLHSTSAPSGGEFERRIGRAFVRVCEQTALLVSS
jgi:hypothetical protein